MRTLLDRFTLRLAGLTAMLVSSIFVTGCFGDPWPRPATPVVAAGRVYATTNGAVVAIDARTGAVILRAGAGAWADAPTAAIDGMLYAGGRELSAVDVAKGSVVWRIPAKPDTSYQYLAADETRVYVRVKVFGRNEPFVMPDDRLVALDRATGRELWSIAAPRGHEVFPADGVIVTVEGSVASPKLVARDAATGVTRWTADDPRSWDPLVAPGRVFVLTGSDVRELEAATGRETWRGGPAAWQAAVGPGTLYGRSGPEVEAIDLASKQPRWKQPCPGLLGAGDGLVVCATTTVTALRADTGAVAWRFELPEEALSRPLIAEGVVLLRASHTELLAVDASTGKARWRLDLTTGKLSPQG